MISLPQTGTSSLLEILSPHLDDWIIDDALPPSRRRGRPCDFSSAQLFRVLLLTLLTPVHSFNLLVKLLPENRAWRKFARLPNQRVAPDVRMLHEFRQRLDVRTLRQINAALLAPLLDRLDPMRPTVAIMDATDLPAPVADGFKKRVHFPRRGPRLERARRKPARAAFLSATKNIRCGFGIRSARAQSCWCRWCHGWPRPIVAMCSFWNRACGICAGARIFLRP
jgi:hypothetical protein